MHSGQEIKRVVLPISNFCGKSNGEDYVWQFMKDNNPESWVSFHNYDYDDRQPDVTLLVPNRGIIIIEIKSYLAKNIRAVPDRTKVLFYNKPPEKSSFDQALGYRDILTTAIKESESVLSDAYVTVASCYPYITEQEYEEKSLNKISTRKLTILKDDFSDGHAFFEKINDILDVAYEAAKNPAKSCNFTGEDFERIGNLISPNFRNIYEDTETTTLINNKVKHDVDYYSKVVTFIRKATVEELKELVDEWRSGGRIFAFFSDDENVDQLEEMITDLMEQEGIKTDLYKDFKPKGRKFNFTYQYVHNLTDELCIFNGDCREKERTILQTIDSSSGASTFLHHTELGEAIKQMTFERDTYLGVAKIFGLRNKEYLMENLQGLKVGDRVTLYRKYNSEDESCTAVSVSNIPDDGSSIRVHTLAGLCLGYIQYPERYVMAELMKAGKHLYAKVHELNVPSRKEDIDTHNAVSLDIYWMEETSPLKIGNTYELNKPDENNGAMEQNGNAIWLMNVVPSRQGLSIPNTPEAHQEVIVGDKLRLIKTASIDDPWCIEVWTADKKRPMGHMESWDSQMIAHMLDAGKYVYGVVSGFYTRDFSNNIRFDVYVEDN